MKFNCNYFQDRAYKKKQAQKSARRKWHLKFAFLPIKIDYSDCRWLEFVWRRENREGTLDYRRIANNLGICWNENYVHWEYRAQEQGIKD